MSIKHNISFFNVIILSIFKLSILNSIISDKFAASSLKLFDFDLINKIENKIYKGNWKNTNNFTLDFSHNNGIIFFILKNLDNKENITKINSYDNVLLKLKIFDGINYDDWYEIYITFSNSTNDINKTYHLNNSNSNILFYSYNDNNSTMKERSDINLFESEQSGEFFKTILSKGHIFSYIIDKIFSSISSFKIEIYNSSDSIIEGSLSILEGTYNINIEFKLAETKELNHGEFSYIIYNIISIAIAYLQIKHSIWLTKEIGDSLNKSNSISLITIGINTSWNGLGCLFNFYLLMNHNGDEKYFILPGIFFFIAFSFYDIKLLQVLWRNKNSNLFQIDNNRDNIRKSVLKFYGIFYISLLLNMIFVNEIYFENYLIYIFTLSTFIPQIIYNIYFKIRISIPLISIFIIGINKVAFISYIRLYSDNIFTLKNDYYLIFNIFVIQIIQIFILYMQYIFGSRPFSKNKSSILYKNISEINSLISKDNKVDCNICLGNLIECTGDIGGNIYIINNKGEFCLNIYNKLKERLFTFHDTLYIKKTDYIVTDCNHAFHTSCLENWIKIKQECPTCRRNIDF